MKKIELVLFVAGTLLIYAFVKDDVLTKMAGGRSVPFPGLEAILFNVGLYAFFKHRFATGKPISWERAPRRKRHYAVSMFHGVDEIGLATYILVQENYRIITYVVQGWLACDLESQYFVIVEEGQSDTDLLKADVIILSANDLRNQESDLFTMPQSTAAA